MQSNMVAFVLLIVDTSIVYTFSQITVCKMEYILNST